MLHSSFSVIPHEVTVTTGDVADAGTDCKIVMTVFGTRGTSSELELEKREDRFERARTNLIKVRENLSLGFKIFLASWLHIKILNAPQ